MVKKLDQELEPIFQKAPHLPQKAIEILVKITPIIILISGLFSITGGLRSIFGANDFYRIFNDWKGVPSIYFYIIGLFQILIGIVSLAAYKPIKNKELVGWFGLLCLNIIQLIMSLVGVVFLRKGLFNLLLSLIINLYVLYEMKSEYKAVATTKTNKTSKVSKKNKKK